MTPEEIRAEAIRRLSVDLATKLVDALGDMLPVSVQETVALDRSAGERPTFRRPPQVRTEKRERGQCPHCLRMISIGPVSGTLRSHEAPVRQEGLPYREVECPGAGEFPRTKRPLWR